MASSAAGILMLSASAQDDQRPINLVDMAKYYSGLASQDRALALLQEQINNTNPTLLQADSIVSNIWRDTDSFAGHTDILSQIPSAQRNGTDPLALAMNSIDMRSAAPVNIEMLTGGAVESPSQVIVTIDQSGMLDDSLAGIRHQFDIAQQNGQWQIQRAGRQVRCQQGRGHQGWSEANCS
ncbi:MAG: hypothetical protein DCF15_03225 [Phormidesmis priestleyi]|uniref:Uncharacterized protein n=1 Tax=Phormidesmis priestleyi TaxID=268141 RepID=A0A2W4ZMS2_9CYAN|nr:MAG: hypothetical protein DCF15_03225 [Phormidesmis priestleyi]